jgi:hypothetical protein
MCRVIAARATKFRITPPLAVAEIFIGGPHRKEGAPDREGGVKALPLNLQADRDDTTGEVEGYKLMAEQPSEGWTILVRHNFVSEEEFDALQRREGE